MATMDMDFKDLERLNIQIDNWIDEEDYEKIYERIKFDTPVDKQINMIFPIVTTPTSSNFNKQDDNDRLFETLFSKNLEKSILICHIHKLQTHCSKCPDAWTPLFVAKYLRSKLQQNGTDSYTKHLDDLVIYLQVNLPYQFPKQGRQYILQHLYLQELSACGKPGLESLGFAVRALELVKKKIGTGRDSHFSFNLYRLWAQYNQGIGYLHSGQKLQAALAFNKIIEEFPREMKSLESEDKDLWESLLFDQTILFKAELLEDLQFSYHTILALKKLGENRKKENRLIKEALAFRDMGRLKRAEEKIKELLDMGDQPNSNIKDIFDGLEKWNIRIKKSSIKSKTLGLLFDYYLQLFSENENVSKNDVSFLKNQFVVYKKEIIKTKIDRTGYFQQVARFLKWLSDKDNFDIELIQELYGKLKDILLPGKLKKHEYGVVLDDFDAYDYDRYVDSMRKFYKNLTEREFYDYIKDENLFFKSLNKYEKKENLLYRFKEFERDLRIKWIESIKSSDHGKECEGPAKCFHDVNRSKAFEGVLDCSTNLPYSPEHKQGKLENSIDCMGSQYPDGRFVSLIADDYETIMRRENDRFLDYLAYKSRHPIYYPQEGKVERSFHFLGLQRWNSQTPTLTLSQGGGYLLYEQDKIGKVTLGIAIDPGFDFVDNLFHMGFTLHDIDFLLLSHSHLDHIRDFEPIVSSLLDLKKRRKNSDKKIHAMMTWGVYRQLEHVITNRTLREFLADTYIIDIDKDNNPNRTPESFSFMRSDTSAGNKYGFESITPDDKNAKRCLQISPKLAYHDDYSERSDSYGFKIDFFGDENDIIFSFGYTGDTKWRENIPHQYKRCDVVCIHLGALIESEKQAGGYFKEYKGKKCDQLIEKKQHPYLFGLLRYIKRIQEDNIENKLLLISEFGEELKGGIRIDFLKRLNRLFESKGKLAKEPVCLPVDIGLDVILAWQHQCQCNQDRGFWVKSPPYKVWCHGCNKFVDAEKIGYRNFEHGNNDEALFYFCNVCLKSKPENAIQDKMRLICETGLPLEKADE